jgi:hypothetical protein
MDVKFKTLEGYDFQELRNSLERAGIEDIEEWMYRSDDHYTHANSGEFELYKNTKINNKLRVEYCWVYPDGKTKLAEVTYNIYTVKREHSESCEYCGYESCQHCYESCEYCGDESCEYCND